MNHTQGEIASSEQSSTQGTGEELPSEKAMPTGPAQAPRSRKPRRRPLSQAKAAAVVEAAEAAFEAQDFQAALAGFQSAMQDHSDLAPAVAGLGATLMALGRPAEALAPLQRAAELMPESSGMHCQLGSAFFSLGQWDAAEAAFLRAMALAPEDYVPYLNLIEVYRGQEELVKATEILERVVNLHPRQVDVLTAFATTSLQFGNLEGAELALTHIRAQQPDHPAVALLEEVLALPAS